MHRRCAILPNRIVETTDDAKHRCQVEHLKEFQKVSIAHDNRLGLQVRRRARRLEPHKFMNDARVDVGHVLKSKATRGASEIASNTARNCSFKRDRTPR